MMLIFLFIFAPYFVIDYGAFATSPLPSKGWLQKRTNIDDGTCNDDTRNELIDALRRISAWADDAITAISPLNDRLDPAQDIRNRRDFERIFRRPADLANRMEVRRAYQVIRDETFRPLRDTRWQDDGLNRITLECQEFDDYDSPCDPFDYGNQDYARSSYREENHLLLCPPYFNLDRHLPRNEIEDSRITVLMYELLDHFPRYFLRQRYGGTYRGSWTFEAYLLTRFAAAMYIRRRDETRIDFPGLEDEEDRLWQVDEEWADNNDPPPDIEEHDAWRYEGEDVELPPPRND